MAKLNKVNGHKAVSSDRLKPVPAPDLGPEDKELAEANERLRQLVKSLKIQEAIEVVLSDKAEEIAKSLDTSTDSE